MGILQAQILVSLIGCLLISEVELRAAKRDVKSFFTREKCMDELGCFSAGQPFFDIVERPLSLLPNDRDEISTKFLLFTPAHPDTPTYFTNLPKDTEGRELDQLTRGGFSPYRTTKFIIPGYISRTAPFWKAPLKNALLKTGPSNVFYVDWTGGDGPLYEQAVANTRVVGAEIALFIQRLQKITKIKPESVHLVGHSLGAHIAGYAGKRLQNLGRITAMDAAGPYFTNVNPVVRLDRNDALFVDAIHTNAAPSRFQGFGLVESIAHFDFFPNGGHLQPGCQDMGEAIIGFLGHPSFDAEGLHDIMCNHARAISLFMSSIENGACQLMGTPCESWDKFAEGGCGSCPAQGCVALGIHADQFIDRIDKGKSISLYLNTTGLEPYCVN